MFLDIQAAFDPVWLDGLRYKLRQLNIAEKFQNVLSSFLDCRTLKVDVSGQKSEFVNLEAGTPQGSCISPILYAIFVNDLPDFVSCKKCQFADDIGIWSSAQTVLEAQVNLQLGLKEIEKWCSKWRIKLNTDKKKVFVFSRCPRHSGSVPVLQLSNAYLQQYESIDLLGVTYDSRLTWRAHLETLVAKAQSKLNLLRAVAALRKEASPNILVKLYKSILRSTFEYSSIAFINTASNHFEKLQHVQNICLRVALKLPAYTPTDLLHDAAGIPKIKSHLVEFSKKRLKKMSEKSTLVVELVSHFGQIQYVEHHLSPLEILLAQH